MKRSRIQKRVKANNNNSNHSNHSNSNSNSSINITSNISKAATKKVDINMVVIGNTARKTMNKAINKKDMTDAIKSLFMNSMEL